MSTPAIAAAFRAYDEHGNELWQHSCGALRTFARLNIDNLAIVQPFSPWDCDRCKGLSAGHDRKGPSWAPLLVAATGHLGWSLDVYGAAIALDHIQRLQNTVACLARRHKVRELQEISAANKLHLEIDYDFVQQIIHEMIDKEANDLVPPVPATQCIGICRVCYGLVRPVESPSGLCSWEHYSRQEYPSGVAMVAARQADHAPGETAYVLNSTGQGLICRGCRLPVFWDGDAEAFRHQDDPEAAPNRHHEIRPVMNRIPVRAINALHAGNVLTE